jgi:hypothetical protein
MSDTDSLINVGELAKPATVLVEKIAEAVGEVFRPTQIRRIARAEADAALIRAQSDVAVSEVQRRAIERLTHEECRKQENIERISAMAIGDLAPDAQPEKLDTDWVAHFFDRGRLISDKQMQELWGRLLAEQANTPGRFSKRTVDLLYTMDASDARAFEQLCRFRWLFGKDDMVPLVFNVDPELAETTLYRDTDVTFDTLTHLDSIGLITFDPIAGYSLSLPRANLVTFTGPTRNWLHWG